MDFEEREAWGDKKELSEKDSSSRLAKVDPDDFNKFIQKKGKKES